MWDEGDGGGSLGSSSTVWVVAWKACYLLAGRLVVGGHAPKQLIEALCGQRLMLIHRAPVIVHLYESPFLSSLMPHVHQRRIRAFKLMFSHDALPALLACYESATVATAQFRWCAVIPHILKPKSLLT